MNGAEVCPEALGLKGSICRRPCPLWACSAPRPACSSNGSFALPSPSFGRTGAATSSVRFLAAASKHPSSPGAKTRMFVRLQAKLGEADAPSLFVSGAKYPVEDLDAGADLAAFVAGSSLLREIRANIFTRLPSRPFSTQETGVRRSRVDKN